MAALGRLLLVGALLLLMGCQSPPGAQLRLTMLNDPQTFNYALNQSAYSVFGYLYEGLVRENGVTGALEPDLAESWELSADHTEIIFTLRPGLQWSDGQPLTVDDVVFTFQEVYLNPQIPTDIKDLLKVGVQQTFPTVAKLNQRQVQFKVKEPFAPFVRYAGELAILPAHALAAAVHTRDQGGNLRFLSFWTTGADPRQIVGNGPYRMTSYLPSQRVVLERNPYYWQRDSRGRRLPEIPQVVLEIIESTDNQLINFRSGGLDALDVSPEDFQLLKREEQRGKFRIYDGGPDTLTSFLTFNLNRARDPQGRPLVDPVKSGWFNDVRFRQAVAYGIDRQRMLLDIFEGLGVLENSPIYPRSPYFLTSGLPIYNYDPAQAKALLEASGFYRDPQGHLRDPQGHPVRFTLLSNSERGSRVAMATQIQQDLGRLGMEVDLQILSFNTYLSKISGSHDWEAYLGGFAGGGIEPHGASNIWLSTGGLHTFNQGPVVGGEKIQGWRASAWELAIDRLYIAADQELDEAKRRRLYAQFQVIAEQELPYIPLVVPLALEAVRDRVRGIEFSALGGAFWNLPQLTLQEAA